jgi:hypothetical protein
MPSAQNIEIEPKNPDFQSDQKPETRDQELKKIIENTKKCERAGIKFDVLY